MKPDRENQLEHQVDQLLKRLPEMDAPRTLTLRVMAAIHARTALPWYRQSWQTWPVPLQAVTLIVLVGSFGGFFYAAWELTRAAGYSAVQQEIGEMFSGASAIWNVIAVLLSAVRLVVERLGTGFIVGCIAAAALAYALFIGLGTVYVRLAFAQRQKI